MFSNRRSLFTVLTLGAAVAVPAPFAFAHNSPSENRGSLEAPHQPAITSPSWVQDAAAVDASAIAAVEPQGRRPAGITEQLADWVTAADDNRDAPFLIVDKLGVRVFTFDAEGQFLGSAPVLVGLARGDDSVPGIGNLKLSQITPEERTTPAGRFEARFGDSDGHGTMLWVDLHDAISLHPVMSVNPGEHRLQRLKSLDPARHRISYGCINVPAAFYDKVVLPALAGGNGAVVYVLPDTKPIDEVFPAFAAALSEQDGKPPRQYLSTADLFSNAPDHTPSSDAARVEQVNDRP